MRPTPPLTRHEREYGTPRFIPARQDIPEEFFRSSNPWHRWVETWFFYGIDGEVLWKPGVDGAAALAILRASIKTYNCEHNQKIAGVAYLLAEWAESFAPRGDHVHSS